MKYKLNKYKKDIYSQCGEDGITLEIFKRLKVEKGWFVDVGAWDGRYLSNTCVFADKEWYGIEIECDKRKLRSLISNFMGNPRIHPVLYKVKQDNLDDVLKLYDVPYDFDLLNIDIDCYDYFVWKNLKHYYPKIVIIETNGKPGDVISIDHGASAEAMIKLGKEKGYKPIAHVGNLIFAREDIWTS